LTASRADRADQPSATRKRFAILHHQLDNGEHWDLLLEQEDSLATWQLPSAPAGAHALPLPARRIADHRKLYLDYEGPISGDRGAVQPFDRGGLRWIECGETALVFELSGQVLTGKLRLTRTSDGAANLWSLAEA